MWQSTSHFRVDHRVSLWQPSVTSFGEILLECRQPCRGAALRERRLFAPAVAHTITEPFCGEYEWTDHLLLVFTLHDFTRLQCG